MSDFVPTMKKSNVCKSVNKKNINTKDVEGRLFKRVPYFKYSNRLETTTLKCKLKYNTKE